MIEYYKQNKEQILKRQKKYRIKNKTKCSNAIRNCYCKKNYGITLSDYNVMLKQQKNRCYICGNKEKRKHVTSGKTFTLALDHNHKTGHIRKLLCRRCNHVLGLMKENIKLFDKMKKYITIHAKEEKKMKKMKKNTKSKITVYIHQSKRMRDTGKNTFLKSDRPRIEVKVDNTFTWMYADEFMAFIIDNFKYGVKEE